MSPLSFGSVIDPSVACPARPGGLCQSSTVAEILLEGNTFFFTQGIACEEFHAYQDVENGHCAVARAKIAAYLLCDHLCPALGVVRVRGRHFPGAAPEGYGAGPVNGGNRWGI